MTAFMQALTEISQRARKVLTKEFGVSDAIRFLSRFQVGGGDYTCEREQRFTHDTVKSIVAVINMQRSGQW